MTEFEFELFQALRPVLKAVLEGSQQRQSEQLRRIATVIALELVIEEEKLEEEVAYRLRELRKKVKR